MKAPRLLAVLAVIVLMLAAVACDAGAPADATPTASPSSEMSADQIADQAVAAGAAVDTCQFDMDMTMDMSFTEAGETYEIPFTITSEGAVDKPNAKLFTASAMAMEVPGEGTMELLLFARNIRQGALAGSPCRQEVGAVVGDTSSAPSGLDGRVRSFVEIRLPRVN